MGTYSPETEMLNLRWGSHQLNLISVFDRLLGNQVFVDVTLACEGISLKVHKAVISAASPYFQKLLMENPCDHPVIILSDLQPSVLQDLVEFMYRGEINVMQDRLNELIKWAEKLQIAGLTETCQGGNEELPPEAATNETRTIYANNSQEFIPQQLIMKTNDINNLVHECRRKRHSTGSYRSEDPEFENGAGSGALAIKQRTAQGDSSDALNLCSNSDVITIAGSKQDVGGVQVGAPTSATVVHAEHIYTNTSMELTDNYQNSVTTHSWTPSHVEGGIYLVTEAATPAKSHLERSSSTPEVGESVIRQSEPLTATVVSAPTQQFHPCTEPQETTETFLTTCGYATTTLATTSSASQTAGTVSVVVEQSTVNVAAVPLETGSSTSSSSVCHICKKVLTSDRYMKAHLKRHDPSRNVHPCPWCTCTYRGRSELLRHQKLKHPDKLYENSSKLKSETVSEATSASSSAAAQASSSSVDQFQMSSADFNQAANAAGSASAGKPILSFLRTQNQPSTSNTNRTKKQTVKTTSNDGENSTATNTGSVTTENSNTAVCPICKKCLTSNRYMKVHLKTHDPVRKLYPCTWCSCVYKGRSELLRHRKTKHPEHLFGK